MAFLFELDEILGLLPQRLAIHTLLSVLNFCFADITDNLALAKSSFSWMLIFFL